MFKSLALSIAWLLMVFEFYFVWFCFVLVHVTKFREVENFKVWLNDATLSSLIKVEMSKEQYFNLASKQDINLALF